MPNFGNGTAKDARQTPTDRFFADRWDRCFKLTMIMGNLSESQRLVLFNTLPQQLEGVGSNPYGDVWAFIKAHPDWVDQVRSAAAREGSGPAYVDKLGVELSSKPPEPPKSTKLEKK